MTIPDADPLDAPTAALAAAVLEIGRHVEAAPLSAIRWFALARSAELLASSPAVAALLGIEQSPEIAEDPLHLTPIELDPDTGAPDPQRSPGAASDPLAGLAEVAWPQLGVGGAFACDLAPEAWAVREVPGAPRLPHDGALRVVVAALADGTTYSALRAPGEDRYVLGSALLPDLADALLQTVQEG